MKKILILLLIMSFSAILNAQTPVDRLIYAGTFYLGKSNGNRVAFDPKKVTDDIFSNILSEHDINEKRLAT